ncbi:hypothetical protein CDAR_104881 [Caerostris darwini]|uniref:Uncharacterized protein n=1 Tax=Caerostris darwini TaxID=1538125 RepID=A0AAV4W2M8_9ARAC|nr:hypothetical protein CDAR_104881 [Caerostris darwini]
MHSKEVGMLTSVKFNVQQLANSCPSDPSPPPKVIPHYTYTTKFLARNGHYCQAQYPFDSRNDSSVSHPSIESIHSKDVGMLTSVKFNVQQLANSCPSDPSPPPKVIPHYTYTTKFLARNGHYCQAQYPIDLRYASSS